MLIRREFTSKLPGAHSIQLGCTLFDVHELTIMLDCIKPLTGMSQFVVNRYKVALYKQEKHHSEKKRKTFFLFMNITWNSCNHKKRLKKHDNCRFFDLRYDTHHLANWWNWNLSYLVAELFDSETKEYAYICRGVIT